MHIIKYHQLVKSAALCGALLLTPTLARADEASGPASVVAAGDHMPSSHHHQMMVKELQKLNLSPDQWQKINALNASFMQAHPEGSHPSKDEMKSHQQSIMAILTPGQQAQFHSDMQQMRAAEGHSPG